jgi:hypothetical protein
MNIKITDLIKTGRIDRAQKIVLYGPNGVGKTTLASNFPDPIFLDTEDGTTHQHLTRIQIPDEQTFFDVLRALALEKYTYRTLVIDTIDVAERFARERVLKRHRMRNIEDFGYGKGWTYLREEFDLLLSGCLDSFIRRGTHVVTNGHSTTRRHQPPGLSDAYDRYELKLDPVNSAKLREWADAVLFLNWDVRVVENTEGRVRGVGGKERVIHTVHSAAWDAKNRVTLPEKLTCEFSAILPLFGNFDASKNQPEKGAGIALNSESDAGAAAVDTGTPQQRLAAALNGEDSEVVRLFLLNRKICTDGQIASIPEDYALRVLENLPRFRERLAKFSAQPF